MDSIARVEEETKATIKCTKVKQNLAEGQTIDVGNDDDNISISSDYEMVSDIFNFDELKELDDFGIKKYKNATYKGQINMETRKR